MQCDEQGESHQLVLLSYRCAESCKAHGIDFLDAPISGGPQRARDGTLTIMCGGTQEVFDKVEPVMRTMGTHVRLIGAHGAGTAAKLVSLYASLDLAVVSMLLAVLLSD